MMGTVFSMCVYVCVLDSEKDDGELGNGIAQWRLNEQLFPCPICGKVFGRQQTLSRHLSLHTGKLPPACCDVFSVHVQALGIHLCC